MLFVHDLHVFALAPEIALPFVIRRSSFPGETREQQDRGSGNAARRRSGQLKQIPPFTPLKSSDVDSTDQFYKAM